MGDGHLVNLIGNQSPPPPPAPNTKRSRSGLAMYASPHCLASTGRCHIGLAICLQHPSHIIRRCGMASNNHHMRHLPRSKPNMFRFDPPPGEACAAAPPLIHPTVMHGLTGR